MQFHVEIGNVLYRKWDDLVIQRFTCLESKPLSSGASDTSGCYLYFPQLTGESVSEFSLPPASGKATARQAVLE
jgi:hypothetical protein